ncbi:hypothetical protein I5Q34_16550 [Streptomyces sp. AV19]|uniref:hypothetical protein n=1 Tax=Streptomyces sp. AV19 TaxID=2793068 RepID=UPI0018FED484|nr:hypothetical protein [Streptomyces sp. AV19]MBH1935858.1 hypothetical protein [Streptomyces sp. AV19]MDG4534358.1 hypothetical protein [Streptomyces sp. AV19]
MALTLLVGECEKGTCPQVFAVDGTDDAIVQGLKVDDPEALETMQLPADETAVRIPVELLRRLAREHLA